MTYTDYLKVDELLNLQELRSKDKKHDEMLFIVIHQVYELWFKQLLHEFGHLKGLLQKGDGIRAAATFKRSLTILKTMVSQVDILETMTPTEFASFRNYLESSSGFQSYQFRAFEFLLGFKKQGKLEQYPEGHSVREALTPYWSSQSLWGAFLQYLARKGYDIPQSEINKQPPYQPEPCEQIQHALVMVYKTNAECVQVCEAMVDLDEGQQEWRYRHVKMVERTIGSKMGTGGSPGVRYLQNTLFQPAFPDLWAIRSEI